MTLCAAEIRVRERVAQAFPGCALEVRRDARGYCARIDLPSGSWCSAKGMTRAGAIRNTLLLGLEPCPGFPGWVEPAWADDDDAGEDELATVH